MKLLSMEAVEPSSGDSGKIDHIMPVHNDNKLHMLIKSAINSGNNCWFPQLPTSLGFFCDFNALFVNIH